MDLEPTEVLKFRLRSEYEAPGLMATETIVVKEGPRAYKTATVLTFGNKETGEVKKRELRVQTWNRKDQGGGFDFEKADYHWHCEDHEIDKVRVLLNSEAPETGTFRLVKEGSEAARILDSVRDGGLRIELLRGLSQAILDDPVLAEYASSDEAQMLARLVTLHRRSESFDRLKDLVSSPTTMTSSECCRRSGGSSAEDLWT